MGRGAAWATDDAMSDDDSPTTPAERRPPPAITPTGDLRSFGRRHGRKLSPRQERLLAELLPAVAVPSAGDLVALVADWTRDGRELWLEIGFGGGEHLVWQASRNSAVTLIGCEPFEEGVVKVLSAIEAAGIGNIRIHADDARPMIRRLPDRCLSRVFVLFPDPWPKRKHAKRRLVATPLLDELARVMRPGAELRAGTDIGDYARTMLIALMAHPSFRWLAGRPSDWRERPADWPQTRYEAKALREGRCGYFLRFCRS